MSASSLDVPRETCIQLTTSLPHSLNAAYQRTHNWQLITAASYIKKQAGQELHFPTDSYKFPTTKTMDESFWTRRFSDNFPTTNNLRGPALSSPSHDTTG